VVSAGLDVNGREVGGAAKQERRMNLSALEFHEIANEFPLLTDQETQELADDIEKNGLEERLVLFEEKILDGRNRYNACKLIKRRVSRDLQRD
jgi:ParB-like chromosome segregation protein Spo0J